MNIETVIELRVDDEVFHEDDMVELNGITGYIDKINPGNIVFEYSIAGKQYQSTVICIYDIKTIVKKGHRERIFADYY